MSSNKQFEIGYASRLGSRRINQDRAIALHSEGHAMLVLADGMGGHPRGERAAEILVETCEAVFNRTEKPVQNPGEFLINLLQRAHELISEFGAHQAPPIEPRTTAVVVLIQKGVAHWAHVGDSRFYLFRGSRLLTRTIDHSYVEKLRQNGLITDDERDTHPHRHYVTRCLGGPLSTPGTALGEPTRLRRGDTLMLCSDGFWSQIEEDEMAAAFEDSGEPLSEVIDELAEEAELKGFPESDNVTAVALRWQSEEELPGYAGGLGGERPQDRLSQAIEELTAAIDKFETRSRGQK